MIGNLYRKTQPRNLRAIILDSPPYFVDCFGLYFDTYYVCPPNVLAGLMNLNVGVTKNARITLHYDFVVFSSVRDQQPAHQIKLEQYIPSIAVLHEEELWPATPTADYYVVPDELYIEMYGLPKEKTAVIDPPVHFIIERAKSLPRRIIANVEKWTPIEFEKFNRIVGSLPRTLFSTINSPYCPKTDNLKDLKKIYESGDVFISYQCPKVRDFEAAAIGLNIFTLDRDNNPELERRRLLEFFENPVYTLRESNFSKAWPTFIKGIL